MLFAKLKRARDVEENIPLEANETLEPVPIVSEKPILSEDHLMTNTEAKQKIREWCLSQVGYHEALDGSNKYADGIWDAKLYGFNAKTVPWCDVFADFAYITCFGFESATKMTYQTPKGYAACKASAEAYQRNGAYFSIPEVGDQIFFFYGEDINHTGIVVGVDGETVTCVEGNYSDGVSMTKYNIRNQWLIAGYGRPDWSVVTDGCGGDACDIDFATVVCNKEIWVKLAEKMPNVQFGNVGNAVKALQAMLNVLGAELDVDGEYGVLTEKEVIEFKGGRL